MNDIIERLNASAAQSEMGRNLAGTPQTCREAAELLRDHNRRVTELLAANNREVENRRMLAAVLRKITRDRNARVHLSDTLFGEIEDALERIAR